MSTPTTWKSANRGSSLVPRFPETPVTRTVLLAGMFTSARRPCSEAEVEAVRPRLLQGVASRQDQHLAQDELRRVRERRDAPAFR